MFGIGFGEMLVIAIVILIAVGPDRMPTFMKAVGRGLREFRRATRELKSSVGLDELLRDDELRRPLAPAKKPAPRPSYRLTAEDRDKELPSTGVDLAYAKEHPRFARAERDEEPPVNATPPAPAAAAAAAATTTAPATATARATTTTTTTTTEAGAGGTADPPAAPVFAPRPTADEEDD